MTRNTLHFIIAPFLLMLAAGLICMLQPGAAHAGPDDKQPALQSMEKGNSSGERSEKEEMQGNISRMQSRIRKLQEKIGAIRDKALDKHPALEDLLKKVVLTRNRLMAENLEQENVDMERLQEIDEKLGDPSVSSEKKQELKEERKKMYLGYRVAENRTAQNEKLQSLREKFYSQLLAAAKKEDPAIEGLLKELNMLEHQIQFARPDAVTGGK